MADLLSDADVGFKTAPTLLSDADVGFKPAPQPQRAQLPSGVGASSTSAASTATPDIRGLINKSRQMGASDDQIRGLMLKAPFLADTWQASEKAGISPDAVFQHFGIAAPAAQQSQAGADINAVGQGLVGGAGSVVAGAGRAAMAAGVQDTQRQLAVMDAIDQGKEVPQDQDAIGYQFLSPDQRAQARAEFAAADAELSKREPNALVRAGTAIEGAAPGMFPVAPENEGIQTSVGRMIGGAAPALAASAVGGPVGVLASMAVIGSQAYEGAYQDAISKGASPDEAENAAGKSAVTQAVTQVAPLGRLIQLVPMPLRDGLMKTLFNLGQHGIELGSANALGTFANNYVAQQTYDPDRPLTQGTGDAALEGAIAGLVIRGTAAGARGAGEAIAAIGKAPDIDSAIAAAGAAVSQPSPTAAAGETRWGDLLGPSATGGITPASDVASTAGAMDEHDTAAAAAGWRRLLPNEPRTIGQAVATDQNTGREYVRDTPVPQSAGAASSRDMAAPGGIPPETPAQIATSLQKMVNQSAEDRLTPQGRDDAVYVPGVERPEAMRDFTPAASGAMSTALEHKVFYNTDSNYHDQYDAQVKKNNDLMVDALSGLFGDANAREAAMDQAKELMPGPIGLFDDEKPVDAQPIADRIHQILASPAGKRDAVASQLNRILPKLYDTNGDLETLPSQLKGIRDDITDKLYDKTPTVEGNAARTARNQLRDVLGVVDDTIADGLPGTKYQDYLANLSAALGKVSKLDYLQKFLTGPRKLTDLAGNLQFRKVQNLLEDIQAHHADQTGGAKELSWQEINQIEAVRNELAAKDLLDRRAAVRGSPTAQITNAAGVLGSGPLGAGVKGAAEMALHAGLALGTHGVGNAALGAYRLVVKPSMQAARERQEAAAAAATKQRLLDTAPSPLNPDLGQPTAP